MDFGVWGGAGGGGEPGEAANTCLALYKHKV